MTSVRGGVVFPHLGTLPSTNKDGWVHYQGNGLWLNDGAKWKQVGINYNNAGSRVQPTLYTDTVTSDANGQFSLTLPTGYFTSIHQVQATTFQANASTSNAAYATVMGRTITSITGRTWTSAGTGTVSLSLFTTTATVAANVPVQLLVIGV